MDTDADTGGVVSDRDTGGVVSGPVVELAAPAKLTLSLRITGVRPDGYHELESEMVALDLADTLVLGPGGGLTVQTEGALIGRSAPGGVPEASPVSHVPIGPDNLVVRALEAVGRTAAARLIKRIPAGAGLGGGSSDAAAVLRWAGCTDPALAARLGADVPFCVVGGRAMVAGIGEQVTPLPYLERSFVLLLLPFGVETAAVYRAWDRLSGGGRSPARHGPTRGEPNDLEAPAIAVEPRLASWRDVFARASGAPPRLAGSGSTWFVEGTPAQLGLEGRRSLVLGQAEARLVSVRTIPAPG